MWIMWPMVLGICERLSAKSCRSCGQWSWVSVNVFPLSHVDHVAKGPGYLSKRLSARGINVNKDCNASLGYSRPCKV